MTEAASEAARPSLSITEAARAAQVDRRTIRRALDAGRFPSARRTDHPRHGPGMGPWAIDVGDLVAAGFQLHAPSAASGINHPDDEINAAELHLEIVELRGRLAVAETLAQERAERIADLQTALRMLTATTGTPTPPTPRRRWWRRSD